MVLLSGEVETCGELERDGEIVESWVPDGFAIRGS
jgi:hypothetical protein